MSTQNLFHIPDGKHSEPHDGRCNPFRQRMKIENYQLKRSSRHCTVRNVNCTQQETLSMVVQVKIKHYNTNRWWSLPVFRQMRESVQTTELYYHHLQSPLDKEFITQRIHHTNSNKCDESRGRKKKQIDICFKIVSHAGRELALCSYIYRQWIETYQTDKHRKKEEEVGPSW